MNLIVDGHAVFAATGGHTFDPARRTMLFLHGAGMDHTCWALPARAFASAGWSVLAVDLPGHGRSKGPPLATIPELATWVVRLLDAAKVEKSALTGHSMGGAIALEAAALSPKRVTSLALIGTAPAIPVSQALLTAARDTPDKAYAMMTEWAHGASARIGGNPVPGIWMTGAARALFARNSPGTLHTDLTACAAWNSGPEAAGKISCPTLVLMGAADVMTPPRSGAELLNLIAGAHATTLTDCGHMIMSEQPDRLRNALVTHFGRVTSST